MTELSLIGTHPPLRQGFPPISLPLVLVAQGLLCQLRKMEESMVMNLRGSRDTENY